MSMPIMKNVIIQYSDRSKAFYDNLGSLYAVNICDNFIQKNYIKEH